MNANDFYDWKQQEITKAVFEQLKSRMELLIEEVIDQTAFTSQSEMAEKAGAIKAIRDVLTITFEDDKQETE